MAGNTSCASPEQTLATGETVLSTVLVVLTPIPFIPQFLKQCRQKSSEGLSLWTMVLMVLLNTFSVAAAMLEKWEQVRVCESEGIACVPRLLDGIQLLALALAGMCALLVLILFHPFDGVRVRALAVAVNVGTLALWGLCIGVSVVRPCGTVALDFADGLAYCGGACAISMYWPQLLETYRQKKSGALSALFYILQALGGYIVFVTQAFFSADPWPVWAPMLISTVTQTACALLAYYYDCCGRLSSASGHRARQRRLLDAAEDALTSTYSQQVEPASGSSFPINAPGTDER